MKIFAIRDECDKQNTDLAYLFYYENERRFYIELPDNADPWKTPLLLASFAKRGEHTINAYWSKLWVQQRIIPSDRQNLGQILRDNRLCEYDEYALLMLSMGRCAQDDYYLAEIDESGLPIEITSRFEKRVDDVVPLSEMHLLVFFRDGITRKCDMRQIIGDDIRFTPVLNSTELFKTVSVQTGGYGISWGENLGIDGNTLYISGETVPLSMTDFNSFVESRIVSSSEAAELLNCSRQNINDLIRRGKLHPVKSSPKNKLFLRSEVVQRMWK